MTVLFIIGRILVGAFFLYNAWQHFTRTSGMAAYAQSKGVPSPRAAVITTGVMMAIGALSVLTGFFIVIGLWLLVIFLIAAAVVMHPFWRETDPSIRSMEIIQFSKDLAIAGALLMLSAIIVVVG